MTRSAFHHEPRTRLTDQQRAKLFLARDGKCHVCLRKLGPADDWIVEHVIALENGGTNENANLDITCAWCRPAKDAKDHGTAAKARAVATRHVVPRKRKEKPRGFRGWRKFNGDVVWRKNGDHR